MPRRTVAILLLALTLAACTQSDRPRTDVEALFAQTPWKTEKDGTETREIALGGGVVVDQEKHGEKVETVEMDKSGHGAVLCARLIYGSSLEWLELCDPSDDIWRRDLVGALQRIDDFIVANSLTPVTKQELDAEIDNRVNRIRNERPSWTTAQIDKVCGGASLFKSIKKEGREKFLAYINDLLSVPRPPVLNPCL